MKHLLRGLFIAVLFICCNFQLVLAQPMQELPVDKNVRIGKLDNGLTYYIRHNALPEKRVEFYIAQKVGSILEEPQQRGLAHFLEHMAFNGTKNFPGDETGLGIVPWCETKGIKFGTNLNAYTSVDQTVYNISNVPTENINVVDSCLLILHDWSSAIDLADKEIDKERGVIREEWVAGNHWISTSQAFDLIRYSEILLNYAEAANEYYGPNHKEILDGHVVSPYEVLRTLRERAGIDPGSDGRYGLKEGIESDYEKMQEAIRLERRIELAFEGHRFFDVRRWMIAETTENQQMHGYKITRSTNGIEKGEKVKVRKHTFREAMYFFPIPYKETVKSDDLLQNPYYE